MNHPLADRFRKFGSEECNDTSPLYSALSLGIAKDEAILDVALEIPAGQPEPNLLFATVHYLLEKHHHPLREFFPSFTEDPAEVADAFAPFRDFVMVHRSEVIALLKSRKVQTNEVRRCAYLFPSMAFAVSHFERRPLALLEIGTSAGLNLAWDRYAYAYGDGAVHGDPASPLRLESIFRGVIPRMPSWRNPEISHRIGLDLNVIDLTNPDKVAWLRALIWPEHQDRRSLLDAAIGRLAEVSLDLRQGNGFEMVEAVASEISPDSLLCIYHTHVANQIPEDTKARFLECLDRIGAERDLVHVFNNIRPHLHLTAYRRGERIDVPLAHTEGHGRWIEWLAGDLDAEG